MDAGVDGGSEPRDLGLLAPGACGGRAAVTVLEVVATVSAAALAVYLLAALLWPERFP